MKNYVVLVLLLLSVSLQAQSLPQTLQQDVEMLATTIGERNPQHYEKLQKAAEYIAKRLRETGLDGTSHDYTLVGRTYSNIICEKPGEKETIVIGAHYDSAHGTPGADDNASGVAVLIAMAKALAEYDNQHTLRFVAFTLEEPPYFRTEDMGSTRYALYLKEQEKEHLKFMVSLEMLGFYSDRKIQTYPHPTLQHIYPAKADYIAVVSKHTDRAITNQFFAALKKHNPFSTQILIAPPTLTGIDFSDHLSFWRYDYPALMVTDTSFYRNENYHRPSDTPDTLDYDKMAKLTEALVATIKEVDKK